MEVKYIHTNCGTLFLKICTSWIILVSVTAYGRKPRSRSIDPCPHLKEGLYRKLIEMGENGETHHCCGCQPGFRLVLSCIPGKFNTTICERCAKGLYVTDNSHNKRICDVDNRPTTTIAVTITTTSPPATTTVINKTEMPTTVISHSTSNKRSFMLKSHTKVTTGTEVVTTENHTNFYLLVISFTLLVSCCVLIPTIVCYRRKRRKNTTEKQHFDVTSSLQETNESNTLFEQHLPPVEEQTTAAPLKPFKHTRNYSDDLRVDIKKARENGETSQTNGNSQVYCEDTKGVCSAKVLEPGEQEHMSTPVSPVGEFDVEDSDARSRSNSRSTTNQYRKESQMSAIKDFFSNITNLCPDIILSDSDVMKFGRSFNLGEQVLKEIQKRNSSTSECLLETFLLIYNANGSSLQSHDIVQYFKSTRQVLLAQKLEENLPRETRQTVLETKL